MDFIDIIKKEIDDARSGYSKCMDNRKYARANQHYGRIWQCHRLIFMIQKNPDVTCEPEIESCPGFNCKVELTLMHDSDCPRKE